MLQSRAVSSETMSLETMALCRVSGVDQRFARSASSTLSLQHLPVSSSPAACPDRQHVSPFPVAPANDFSSAANLSSQPASDYTMPDDQPLDLTGGGAAARKRRGTESPGPVQAADDADSPLDLSVKRSRTDDTAVPLPRLSVLHDVDHAIPGGARGGLAMCGGGVVAHSPLRSVNVARSPVPLGQLHASGQHLLPVDAPRLDAGVGAVPVIRRASSAAFHGSSSGRGSRSYAGQPRTSSDSSSRMISDGVRPSNARHGRDVSVVVNGHRPEVLVDTAMKQLSTGSRGDVVHPAFAWIDYAGDLRGASPGRQVFPGKAGVTILGTGRSAIEPLVAGSPTSVSSLTVCSAYITPPPVRPNAVHCGSVARRLDSRPPSKAFQTALQAHFPDSSSLMSASHRVTLVDRLDPTDTHQSSTFFPPNVVVSSSLNHVDGRIQRQLNSTETAGAGGFAAPVWNSLTNDVADSERTTLMKSGERLSAFSSLSAAAEKRVTEAEVVDDRRSLGDGGSTIVAERNFSVTQMVDFVERQRAPLSAAAGGCTSGGGGSLLGHLASATPRRVPVANVHPIMKDSTRTSTVTAPPTSSPAELSGPGHRGVQPTAAGADEDAASCSQLSAAAVATASMSSARQPETLSAPAKDVTALLAAGLSRGGRVSSHHMEYVKFLSSQSGVDDCTPSAASPSVIGGTLTHPRAARTQTGVDRRRGSTRGGLACLSAKVRRQLLPAFHHSQPSDEDRHPAQSVPGKTTATTAADSKPAAATDTKTAAFASSEQHSNSASTLSSSSPAASVGRKTTPIVYFDDDESTATSSTTATSGSELVAAVKRWRQGPSSRAGRGKQPAGRQRKTTAVPIWNSDVAQLSSSSAAGDGKRATKQRRVKRTTELKNDRVVASDRAKRDNEDELTDFEGDHFSASIQVSI